jgi:ligand-binding sensor domain-containing protein
LILMFKYILEYDPSTNGIRFIKVPVNYYVSGVLRGNVLFAVTDGKGLVEIDWNSPSWERRNPLTIGGKTEHAYSIYQDKDEFIVGYTNPFGLWKYDPSIRKHEQIPVLFDQHQGRDTAINHIIKDNDGYYWVSTNQGLYQFDQKWNVVQAYGDFVTDKGSNIPTNRINQVLIASDNTL